MTIRYEKHVVIDSDFTDQIEAWSTLKTHLELTIRKEDHTHEAVRGHIADLFAKNHVEHIRMADGREFDLAQVTGVKEITHPA